MFIFVAITWLMNIMVSIFISARNKTFINKISSDEKERVRNEKMEKDVGCANDDSYDDRKHDGVCLCR